MQYESCLKGASTLSREPGVFVVSVEYGKDLTNKDWFSKQDPYCILTYGEQKGRTKTHFKAGASPVWHEDFVFDALPDDEALYISVMDEDFFTQDDLLGICTVTTHHARAQGHERVLAPVVSKKGKQHGFVSVSLKFTPTRHTT